MDTGTLLPARGSTFTHLFVGLQDQAQSGYLLSLGAEQRLQLQDLLQAALPVLVQQRSQLPGCSPLLGQLQRPVHRPLEVLHLGRRRWRGKEDMRRQEDVM